MDKKIIRVGSRASKLAVVQSECIMAQIQKIMPDVELELVTMTTTGDRILNKTLDQIGGKGLFLKELDSALMERRVDICVHSLKDVPTEENPLIPIGAYSLREIPWDVLVFPKGTTEPDMSLPVGCASARRTLQFQKLHPEWKVRPVRGNVLTRLAKLDRGEYGALILAEAGLTRLGLTERISYRFSPEEMIPAAGQGIMAVQGRAGEFSELLENLNDPNSELCAKTERMLSKELGGDCSSPIGCFAAIDGDIMTLRGFYGVGDKPVSGCISGKTDDSEQLVKSLAAQLKAQDD